MERVEFSVVTSFGVKRMFVSLPIDKRMKSPCLLIPSAGFLTETFKNNIYILRNKNNFLMENCVNIFLESKNKRAFR